MHNCVSLVNGKILHGEDICGCGNNSLFFCNRRYIFAGFVAVFTFTTAILSASSRPMHSVATPGISAGTCKCRTRQSAILNVRQSIQKTKVNNVKYIKSKFTANTVLQSTSTDYRFCHLALFDGLKTSFLDVVSYSVLFHVS